MGTGITLSTNQLKALEMVSAEFLTDDDLYAKGISDADLDFLTLNRLIDWDGWKFAFVMLEMGNIVLAEYNKHPLQQIQHADFKAGEMVIWLKEEKRAIRTLQNIRHGYERTKRTRFMQRLEDAELIDWTPMGWRVSAKGNQLLSEVFEREQTELGK